MNFMISLFDSFYQNHRKKVMTMTTDTSMYTGRSDSAKLLKLRRDKLAERRRRQMSAFCENYAAQNADKVIFLFDGDKNIA